MARKIGLVAASKRRRGGIARAHEQFEPSPVFRRARDFCDRSYSEWYVLSTMYLLAPPQPGPALSGRIGMRALLGIIAGQRL